MRSSLFSAVALLVSTVVGAGIFSLPYGVAQSGLWASLVLIIGVGALVYVLHLLYGEILLRTRTVRQFPGLVGVYLGNRARWLATLLMLLSGYGSLLAYLVGMGTFAAFVLQPMIGGSPFLYGVVLFVLFSVALVFGPKLVVSVQRYLFALLIIVVTLLIVTGFPAFEWQTLEALETSWSGRFSLYSFLLFAFMGTAALVDVERVLSRQKQRMRLAISLSFLILTVLYVVFAFVVVGVSGGATSQQAIEGLEPFLGSGILTLGAVLGLFAMGSSYLTTSLAIQGVFELDFGRSKWVSWLLTIVPATVVFVAGVSSFSLVIEVVGSIIVGAMILLILLMHARAQEHGGTDTPAYTVTVPRWVRGALMLLFAVGIVYQFGDQIVSLFR